MDAETLLGEFLERAEKAKGCESGGRKKIDGTRKEPSKQAPTLADIGLTKKESADAQALKRQAPEQHQAVRTGEKTKTQVSRELKEATR